jgi:hypothetical protein
MHFRTTERCVWDNQEGMNGDWRRHIPQQLLRVIVVPWTLCLIVGSLLPDDVKESIGTHSHHRPYHFIAFGATALLFLLISNTRRQEWISVGGAFALGLSLETLQCLLDGYFEWWDLRDDALGILLAFALFRMADRWLSTNREANT